MLVSTLEKRREISENRIENADPKPLISNFQWRLRSLMAIVLASAGAMKAIHYTMKDIPPKYWYSVILSGYSDNVESFIHLSKMIENDQNELLLMQVQRGENVKAVELFALIHNINRNNIDLSKYGLTLQMIEKAAKKDVMQRFIPACIRDFRIHKQATEAEKMKNNRHICEFPQPCTAEILASILKRNHITPDEIPQFTPEEIEDLKTRIEHMKQNNKSTK